MNAAAIPTIYRVRPLSLRSETPSLSIMPDEKPFTDSKKPDLDNPHRIGNESAADNFSANHESTYDMLHNEMKGRVHVDQDTVWTQLKVDNVDADLVKACCQQLEITCKSDIDGLKKIVDPNTRRPVPEMYPFLVRFSFLLAELNLYLRVIGHNIQFHFAFHHSVFQSSPCTNPPFCPIFENAIRRRNESIHDRLSTAQSRFPVGKNRG